MAENVGRIEITAVVNTRDLDNEVKDAADESGKVYGDRFGKTATAEMNQHFSHIGNAMRSDMVRAGRQSGEWLGSSLDEEATRLIDAAVKKWDTKIAKGLTFAEWGDALSGFRDLDDGMERIVKRITDMRDAGKATDEQLRAAQVSLRKWVDNAKGMQQVKNQTEAADKALKEFTDDFDAMSREAEKAQKSANFTESSKSMNRYKDSVADTSAMIRDLQQALSKMGKSQTFKSQRGDIDVMAEAVRKFQVRLEETLRSQRDSMQGMSKDSQEYAERMREAAAEVDSLGDAVSRIVNRSDALVQAYDDQSRGVDRLNEVLRDNEVAARRANTETDNTVRVLGRLKGSRNNFLNLIGSISTGFENLVKSASTAGPAVAGAFRNFQGATEGLGKLQKSLKLVQLVMQGLGSSMAGITSASAVAGLGSFVAGVYALSFTGELITSVAAGISTLTGALVALASAVGSAFGGALLSAGPIMGALAASVGAVTFAVLNNKDAFEQAIGPLRDWSADVGNAVAKDILPQLAKASDDLAGTLRESLTPMLKESGSAAGDWAADFAAAMESDAMQSNLDVFAKTWPDIMENFGEIFNSVFQGIMNVMAAISPTVKRATDSISAGAEEFAKWTGSAEGKNAVQEWFEGAWDSAQKLWEIAQNLGTALGNIFGAGKDTGDDFLTSIEEITDEFAKWTDGEGRDEISEWFTDAKDAASAVWDVLQSIGEAFDDWDTEENREDFETLLGTVEKVVGGISGLVKTLDGIWESLTFQEGNPIQEWFDNTVTPWWNDTALPWFKNLPSSIGDALTGWAESMPNPLADWWEGTVVPWWDETGYPWISGLGPDLAAGFSEGVDTAMDGLGKWWSDLWNGLVENVKSWLGISSPSTVFSGIGEDIMNGLIEGIKAIWGEVQAWWTDTALPWFKGLPAQVGGWFSEMWSKFTTGISTGWAGVTTWWNDTVLPWFAGLPGKVGQWFANIWSKFSTGIATGWAAVTTWWNSTVLPWFAGLPARAGQWFSNIWAKFSTGISAGWAKVTTWWNSTVLPWFAGLPAKVGQWFSNIWAKFTTGISAGWAKVTTWWSSTVVPWFAGLPAKVGKWFSNIWDKFTTGISAGWKKVTTWWTSTAVPWFTGLPAKVGRWFTDMWSKFTTGISAGWQKVKDWWSDTAVPWFQDLPNKVMDYFEDMWDKMVEAAKAIPGKISEWWNGPAGWDRIVALITGKDWASLGADAANGFLEGLEGVPIVGRVASWVQSALNSARSALDSNSPSKETMKLGQYFGDGFALGITSRSAQVQAAAHRLGVDALRAQMAGGAGVGNVLREASGRANVNRPAKSSSVQAAAAGRQIIVADGAIRVEAPHADQRLVAAAVLDRLVRSNVG